MADNINNSNKPVNGRMAKPVEELINRQAQAVDYSTLIAKSKTLKSLEDKLYDIQESQLKIPNSSSEYANLVEQEEYVSAARWEEDERLHTLQNEILGGGVGTYYRSENIKSRMVTESRLQKHRKSAGNDPEIYASREDLESRREEQLNKARELGQAAAGNLRAIGTGEPDDFTLNQLKQAHAAEGEASRLNALISVQNKRGLSEEKILDKSKEQQDRFAGFSGAKQLEEDIKLGKRGTYKESVSKWEKTDEQLRSALTQRETIQANRGDDTTTKEYKEAGKELAELTKKVVKLTEELDAAGDEVAEQRKQGKDRDGGGYDKARAAFGALAIGAQAGSTIRLDYELEQTQLRTGMAGLVNRQYKQTGAAIGGDMSALLEITQGDAFRKLYADQMGDKAQFWKGLEGGAAIGDAAVTTLAAAGEGFGLDAGGAEEQAEKTAGSIANAAKITARQGMKLDKAGYALKAGITGQELATALNEIPAESMQTYFDVNRGAFDAGVGLGRGRNAFMKNITSLDMGGKFAEAGMTHKDANKVAAMGASAVGTAEDSSELALKAAKAQQRGILGVADYMSNVGQLANAGGGSADLESIMSKAVSAGMDNAKNINQMVAATSKLAASSAAIGMSTTSSTSHMLASSIQSMRDMGVNKNLATDAAANALDAANQAGNVMGSFADLQYRAGTENIYGPLSLTKNMSLRNLDQAKMAEILKGGKGSEGARYVEEMGMGSTLGYNTETGKFNTPQDRAKFEQLRREYTKKQVIEELGPSFAMSNKKLVNSVVAFRMDDKGATLNEKDREAYGSQTGRYARGLKYNGAVATTPNTPGDQEVPFIEQDKTKAKFDLSKETEGKTKIDEELGGMAGLVEILEIAREAADPKHMAEAVKQAAADLKVPASIFGGHVTRFDGAVSKFVNGLEKMGVAVDPEGNVVKNLPGGHGASGQWTETKTKKGQKNK